MKYIIVSLYTLLTQTLFIANHVHYRAAQPHSCLTWYLGPTISCYLCNCTTPLIYIHTWTCMNSKFQKIVKKKQIFFLKMNRSSNILQNFITKGHPQRCVPKTEIECSKMRLFESWILIFSLYRPPQMSFQGNFFKMLEPLLMSIYKTFPIFFYLLFFQNLLFIQVYLCSRADSPCIYTVAHLDGLNPPLKRPDKPMAGSLRSRQNTDPKRNK